MGQGLADLEEAREEVVAEVLNAPKRRVDNEVSRLSDSVCVLQMHCKIIEDIVKTYRSSLFRARLSLTAAAIFTVILPSAVLCADTFSFYQVMAESQNIFLAATGTYVHVDTL